VRFYNREDVVHGPVPFGTPFFLIWKRWRRQSIASAGAFRYKVLLGLRGLPAHTWAGTPTRRAREDLRKYFVAAWCIHPRFIPQQKIIAIPESEVPFVVEPPLYLREYELIRSELPALRHLVRVRVVEVLRFVVHWFFRSGRNYSRNSKISIYSRCMWPKTTITTTASKKKGEQWNAQTVTGSRSSRPGGSAGVGVVRRCHGFGDASRRWQRPFSRSGLGLGMSVGNWLRG
jgi:hypothetical protein